MNYLKCKRIDTAIKRAKKKISNKEIYENFGQEEVRNIEQKFINLSDYTDEMNYNRDKLKRFNDWCMNYTGN